MHNKIKMEEEFTPDEIIRNQNFEGLYELAKEIPIEAAILSIILKAAEFETSQMTFRNSYPGDIGLIDVDVKITKHKKHWEWL